MKSITPVIVGSGMAGRAIRQSLAIVSQMNPDLDLLPALTVQRGKSLNSYIADGTENILFLANPSALHAPAIMEGSATGFSAIAAEKPVCVLADEIVSLKKIEIFVSVYHVYH